MPGKHTKEYKKKYNHEYYLKNRERELERSKKYQKEHRQIVSKREKEYHKLHRENYRFYDKRWRSIPINAEKTRINAHLQQFKRATKVYVTTHDILTMLDNIEKENDGKLVCYYCGKVIDRYARNSYHIEHKLPICKGGQTTIENLCISCPECNLKKGRKLLEEFIA